MSTRSKRHTPETRKIESVLKAAFPRARIDVYALDRSVIRARVISRRFRGLSLIEREEMVLPVLDQLPDDVVQDITVLLLLAPGELKPSAANLEFEKPTPLLL